eukprot:TRINITY_DN27145_c0_g2_i4.p2 TRINITY_DN27145_c0_g2~~TRINITY_DN27145_c0_g2_i4.p2  ORF type:complete len:108 (+),score=20.96 TRINITY_DN27145_c0_g2_i4:640-963(+)
MHTGTTGLLSDLQHPELYSCWNPKKMKLLIDWLLLLQEIKTLQLSVEMHLMKKRIRGRCLQVWTGSWIVQLYAEIDITCFSSVQSPRMVLGGDQIIESQHMGSRFRA